MVGNYLTAASICALFLGNAAEAATLNIKATVLNGLYAGFSVVGTLGYDESVAADADLFNPGTEAALTPYEGAVTLSFGVGAMTLTEKNDAGYDGFPRVTFVDGALADINYWVKHGVSGADLLPFGVKEFRFLRVTPGDEADTYDVGVDVEYGDPSEVPLPAGLPLLAGGLALMAAFRRQRRV